MTDNKNDASNKPNKEISVREAFGIETDMVVKGFEEKSDRVPDIDETYNGIKNNQSVGFNKKDEYSFWGNNSLLLLELWFTLLVSTPFMKSAA